MGVLRRGKGRLLRRGGRGCRRGVGLDGGTEVQGVVMGGGGANGVEMGCLVFWVFRGMEASGRRYHLALGVTWIFARHLDGRHGTTALGWIG